MERRNLLRAAAVAPAAALIPTPALAYDASSKNGGRSDSASPRFALAVLPDTQYLFDADSADPAPLRETFDFLLRERGGEDNVAFMTHLGDVTEHGTEQEIALAGQTFKALDGKLPYSVLGGNHDVSGDDQRGSTPYLKTFGPSRFKHQPSFLGATADGYNSAHVFKAAGRQWLVLALDWRISDQGIAWAQGVLTAHPTLPAIVTTHDIAFADDNGQAYLSDNGRRLWDHLIKANDQVFLALGGHYWPPGRTVLKNDAGHDVHVHITNYQDRYYGGAAMIRLYHFDLERNRVDVETFAPWFLARDPARRTPLEAETIELTSDVNRFSLDVDFDERFAAFAPPALPKPRPAAQVVDRHTVAYWRFDQAGQSVADGAQVKDWTGKGNDLTVRRLANSTAETLTLAADHHEGAPAHASLKFDGGKNPDRGAILQTGPNAPVNSMKFLGGYTIELFMKLPDPYEGDHSWMGVFSWEGRSGDAGKHAGYSETETTCSMNVTGERFLQYNVYAQVGDVNPTAWSHALPTGVWQHVAIVNDGKRSVVWVDGSRIARNPSRITQGIATLGRPFTLGANSDNLSYGQGFYGWIGDVRISDRALKPSEFLPNGHFTS
ncbi:LamG-like jellyroll fold domain-containing protein [Actinoplanes awajinensis]|uniref:LamG-like jellyroll fold domain-containing protein n=1 Tax=Actinoplanes awajinensis TaxID=135946 RepID=UPI000A03AC8E|nr:LamG-like jellyroll fold domain-containing protein [Actinoplanes awajinensis]